jgi:multiple antibiotic resistance protein
VLESLLLAFIPVFVAVDAVGVLPIFTSLTEGMNERQRREIITQSLMTALCLALAFILLGKFLFQLLGITMGDFMVAGGIILLCIAVTDLLIPGKQRRIPEDGFGVVPIGTPLVVGPAVLTTSLMLIDQYGVIITLLAVFINLVIVGMVFFWSARLFKFLGNTGARALSKVMALLLSAIAVMMIRKGIIFIIASY